MLFAVDIGNTNIVAAIFDGDKIAVQWRIATDSRRTGDEYTSILLTLCRNNRTYNAFFKKLYLDSGFPAKRKQNRSIFISCTS